VVTDSAARIFEGVTFRASRDVTDVLGPIPAENFDQAADEMRNLAADLLRRNYTHDAALAALAADRLAETAELTRVLRARTAPPTIAAPETALYEKELIP
jgi:hypothetical protein